MAERHQDVAGDQHGIAFHPLAARIGPAAVTWLGDNFTLDENPGMGANGQFYYYHTMSKSLTAAKLDELKLKDGKLVAWREGLANKLFTLQHADGSWTNTSGKWMESDPVLVSSYVLMALGHLVNGL